jgi:hypothetical protein
MTSLQKQPKPFISQTESGKWCCYVETFPNLPHPLGFGDSAVEAYNDWLLKQGDDHERRRGS